MSKDHKSSGFSYYLKLFLAEIPSGKPAKKDTAITGSHSDQTKPESAAARELTARALEIYLGLPFRQIRRLRYDLRRRGSPAGRHRYPGNPVKSGKSHEDSGPLLL